MDLEEIKELMATMEQSGVTKITIKKKDGEEVSLERSQLPAPAHPTVSFQPINYAPEPSPQSIAEAPKEEPKKADYITSPMVGTFYASPSPDQPSFVQVGDRVDENTVVCIVEAMKVMNEVKAGASGVIKEICLESGEPVEFGSHLFVIGK